MTSPFSALDPKKCKYTQSKIYLGIQGRAYLKAPAVEVTFSISIQDGVLAKIKHLDPYCINLEYVDGNYFLNDELNPAYQQLLADIASIQESYNKTQNYNALFPHLEKAFWRYVNHILSE